MNYIQNNVNINIMVDSVREIRRASIKSIMNMFINIWKISTHRIIVDYLIKKKKIVTIVQETLIFHRIAFIPAFEVKCDHTKFNGSHWEHKLWSYCTIILLGTIFQGIIIIIYQDKNGITNVFSIVYLDFCCFI